MVLLDISVMTYVKCYNQFNLDLISTIILKQN